MSHIIITCAANANPKFNRLQLRTEPPTYIELQPGENVLDVKQHPDLRYGFHNNIRDMLSNCQSVIKIDLSNFDASQIKSANCMFSGMESLTTVDLTNVIFSNVENMDEMFLYCTNLKQIICNKALTFQSNRLVSAIDMFAHATSIKELAIPYLCSSSVKQIYGMFRGMTSLEELDLSGWNIRGVNAGNIEVSLFMGCESLNTIYMYGCNDISISKIKRQIEFAKNYGNIPLKKISRALFCGAK